MLRITIIASLLELQLCSGAEFHDLDNNVGSLKKDLRTSLDLRFVANSANRVNDPELELDGLNPARYIASRGFRAENYHVATHDGYILDIYRVVNPLANKHNAHLKPVILQHGLMMSCYDWMINDESGHAREPSDPRRFRNLTVGRNLVFELANLGFDVWLGNSRGDCMRE